MIPNLCCPIDITNISIAISTSMDVKPRAYTEYQAVIVRSNCGGRDLIKVNECGLFELHANHHAEHDINLFDQEGLYDVNVIGSLFKMWLRNLPEPILSEAIQDELIAKYDDQKQAPGELKEILSKLSPWNYYLLFAITCHLSLLNAYEEKNKMSLNNLFICVGPGLRMKQRCFTWLVGDWRSCWTGCTTEKEALEDEYRVLDGDFLPANDIKERKDSSSSVASNEAVTPPSEVAAKPQSVEPVTHATATGRRKENRPPRLTSGRSKDDTYLMVNRPAHQDLLSTSVAHGRSNSHIPELDLPGKMSPIFAPDATE